MVACLLAPAFSRRLAHPTSSLTATDHTHL